MSDQTECAHLDLVNGGNATHSWKRCKTCKRIVHRVHKATGVEEHLVGVCQAERLSCEVTVCEGQSEALVVGEIPIHGVTVSESHRLESVIADSGCRRNVADKVWHERMSILMRTHSIQPQKIVRSEKFRLGDERIESSDHAWQYPVRLGNSPTLVILDIAEVACACPALLSNGSMETLKIILDFNSMRVSSSPPEDHGLQWLGVSPESPEWCDEVARAFCGVTGGLVLKVGGDDSNAVVPHGKCRCSQEHRHLVCQPTQPADAYHADHTSHAVPPQWLVERIALLTGHKLGSFSIGRFSDEPFHKRYLMEVNLDDRVTYKQLLPRAQGLRRLAYPDNPRSPSALIALQWAQFGAQLFNAFSNPELFATEGLLIKEAARR
eukprot:1024598-Amphidinium_carterae.1